MPRKRKPPGYDVSMVKTKFSGGLVDGITHFVAEYEAQYEETGNPLYVWQAIGTIFAYLALPNGQKKSLIQSGYPLPKWINDYLLQCVGNLFNKEKTMGQGVSVIPGLLGFETSKSSGGGDSVFSQYHNYKQRYYVLARLRELLETKPKLSIEAACQQIVDSTTDLDVDPLTVKRWYDQSNKAGEVYRPK